MNILGTELKEHNEKGLKEKYFFEKFKTSMKFMIIVYIHVLIIIYV